MFNSIKTIVLLVCFSLFISVAVAQKEFEKDVIGTWKIDLKATEVLAKEKNPALKDMPEMVKKIYNSIRFEFQKTGKYKAYHVDNTVKCEPIDGTWVIESSTITVTNSKDGKEEHLNIVGIDLMELRLHDVNRNVYMVLTAVFE